MAQWFIVHFDDPFRDPFYILREVNGRKRLTASSDVMNLKGRKMCEEVVTTSWSTKMQAVPDAERR